VRRTEFRATVAGHLAQAAFPIFQVSTVTIEPVGVRRSNVALIQLQQIVV